MAERRPVSHKKQQGIINRNRAVIGGSEARTNKPSIRRQDCACSLI